MVIFAPHADYMRQFDLWVVYFYFKTNNRCVAGIWKKLHGYDKAGYKIPEPVKEIWILTS